MSQQREIPGYYYDSAKRKYFRIEANRTAPAEAAWSAQNVKRRAVEQQRAERARRAVARRAARTAKRARILQAPLLGGLLMREAGLAGQAERAGVGVPASGDVVGRAWAEGLRARGEVDMWPPGVDLGGRSGVSAFCVASGEGEGGLGLVVALADVRWVASSYIPCDDGHSINFGGAAARYPHLSFAPHYYSGPGRDHTAVKFHEPTRRILVAHSHPGPLARSVSIEQYTCQFPEQGRPSGSYKHLSEVLCGTIDGASDIHALQPAPASSPLTCIAGTNQGVVQVHPVGGISWLTPLPTAYQRRLKRQRTQVANPPEDPRPWQCDVLAVDFLAANPAAVVLAGTRSSHICLFDIRTPPKTWSARANTFCHTSSVAHLRSVGAHGVLAAGPRSAMALYDVRFLPRPPLKGGKDQVVSKYNDNSDNWTRPVVTFPAYRNEAHINIGLDVLPTPGYGSAAGVVAAAHDDKTVALYSLADGARLCGAAAGAVGAIKARGVVKSLQWQTLPGERHPSLFVSEGTWVKKYSFCA